MVVVAALIKGKPVLDAMRPTKREMFQEIYNRVLALQKQFPKASMFELVLKAVNSPAPKFYMTPRSAMETIYKIKRVSMKNKTDVINRWLLPIQVAAQDWH